MSYFDGDQMAGTKRFTFVFIRDNNRIVDNINDKPVEAINMLSSKTQNNNTIIVVFYSRKTYELIRLNYYRINLFYRNKAVF